MHKIEQTLTSMEVAEMVEKEHKYLMRDIKRYTQILTGAKISPVEFFKESTYKDVKGESRPCYKITLKGCEFIGHKVRGEKGILFTARYINRFHEMEDILKGQQESKQPWFIRNFGDCGKIMLFRDFKAITGIELFGNYTALKRPDRLVGGLDYNGWGWYTKINREDFLKEYGFDYGDDKCMEYLYFRGIRKAVRAVENDINDRKKLTKEIKKMILDGVNAVEGEEQSVINTPKRQKTVRENPIQITLVLNQNGIYELQ